MLARLKINTKWVYYAYAISVQGPLKCLLHVFAAM